MNKSENSNEINLKIQISEKILKVQMKSSEIWNNRRQICN